MIVTADDPYLEKSFDEIYREQVEAEDKRAREYRQYIKMARPAQWRLLEQRYAGRRLNSEADILKAYTGWEVRLAD